MKVYLELQASHDSVQSLSKYSASLHCIYIVVMDTQQCLWQLKEHNVTNKLWCTLRSKMTAALETC